MHNSYEIIYISWGTKIGHHDIVDKIEPENISREFDTFSVMVCDAFDTERTIADTDSFSTTEYKAITS